MSEKQRFILKTAFFVALFIVGFVFHDEILGVAK